MKLFQSILTTFIVSINNDNSIRILMQQSFKAMQVEIYPLNSSLVYLPLKNVH